jgi:hypothetical protein
MGASLQAILSRMLERVGLPKEAQEVLGVSHRWSLLI